MTSSPQSKQTCQLAGLAITFIAKSAVSQTENGIHRSQPKKSPELIVHFDSETLDNAGYETVERIEFFAPATWKHRIKPIIKNRDWQHLFDMETGHNVSSCYFTAVKGAPDADWNFILQPLFEICLLEGRPVHSYKTTFLFPFILKKTESDDHRTAPVRSEHVTSIPNRAEDAETLLYFLPHVRNVLFGNDGGETSHLDRQGIRPLERYELKRRGLYITLDANGPVSLSAAPVRLFCFPNNSIYFLSFELTIKDALLKDEKHEPPRELKDLNTPLDLLMALKEKEKRTAIQKIQAHRFLAVNELARIVYPSFREQADEEKIAKLSLFSEENEMPLAELLPVLPARGLKGLHPRLSPIVRYLVQEMLDVGKMDIFPLADDRMFVITHLALWGEKPVTKEGKRAYEAFYSRALYVDKGSDDCPGEYIYDASYVQKRFENEVLRIWEGPYGNLYGFTDFSNVYTGFGSFFADITSRHIHTIYFYMALLALYYRVSLTAFTAQLARETGRLLDSPRKSLSRQRIRGIRDSFTRFTNQYWFREVSSQMQGLEIFNYQNRSLHMETEYNGFKEELERADALIQVRWQDKIAFIGTVLTAVLSIAGLSDKSIYLQISVGILLIIIMFYVYPSTDFSKKNRFPDGRS